MCIRDRRYIHADNNNTTSNDLWTYIIPKDSSVYNKQIGEYRMSSTTLSTSSTTNDHSNPHYDLDFSSNNRYHVKTTPYKKGAIVYMVGGSSTDPVGWVKNDIILDYGNTMEGGVLRQDNTAVYLSLIHISEPTRPY